MKVWTRLSCHTFRAHMTYVYQVFRKYSQFKQKYQLPWQYYVLHATDSMLLSLPETIGPTSVDSTNVSTYAALL
jgi:hypothetical protein